MLPLQRPQLPEQSTLSRALKDPTAPGFRYASCKTYFQILESFWQPCQSHCRSLSMKGHLLGLASMRQAAGATRTGSHLVCSWRVQAFETCHTMTVGYLLRQAPQSQGELVKDGKGGHDFVAGLNLQSSNKLSVQRSHWCQVRPRYSSSRYSESPSRLNSHSSSVKQLGSRCQQLRYSFLILVLPAGTLLPAKRGPNRGGLMLLAT